MLSSGYYFKIRDDKIKLAHKIEIVSFIISIITTVICAILAHLTTINIFSMIIICYVLLAYILLGNFRCYEFHKFKHEWLARLLPAICFVIFLAYEFVAYFNVEPQSFSNKEIIINIILAILVVQFLINGIYASNEHI